MPMLSLLKPYNKLPDNARDYVAATLYDWAIKLRMPTGQDFLVPEFDQLPEKLQGYWQRCAEDVFAAIFPMLQDAIVVPETDKPADTSFNSVTDTIANLQTHQWGTSVDKLEALAIEQQLRDRINGLEELQDVQATFELQEMYSELESRHNALNRQLQEISAAVKGPFRTDEPLPVWIKTLMQSYEVLARESPAWKHHP